MSKRFNYTDLAWIELKEQYLNSDPTFDLTELSFERSGVNFPRWKDLEKRSNAEKWDLLKSHRQIKNGEDPEVVLPSIVSKKLEKIEFLTDKLDHIYSTLQVTKRLQSDLENIFPFVNEALRRASWDRLMNDPERLVRSFKGLVEAYKMLNSLQAQYLGLSKIEDSQEALEASNRFDSSQSLQDVQSELAQMEDQDLAAVISEFLS